MEWLYPVDGQILNSRNKLVPEILFCRTACLQLLLNKMKKNFRVKNPAGIPQHLVDEDNKSPGSTMCLKAMMFVGVLIIAQYVISQMWVYIHTWTDFRLLTFSFVIHCEPKIQCRCLQEITVLKLHWDSTVVYAYLPTFTVENVKMMSLQRFPFNWEHHRYKISNGHLPISRFTWNVVVLSW